MHIFNAQNPNQEIWQEKKERKKKTCILFNSNRQVLNFENTTNMVNSYNSKQSKC